MKKRINISLDEDTLIILKALDQSSHKLVSKWITDKVLEEKKKEDKEYVTILLKKL